MSANTVQANFMLVDLIVSFKEFSMQDNSETEKLCDDTGATKGAARVRKTLIDKKYLKSIRAEITAAKATHAFMTLPYLDRSYRMLRSTLYMQYISKMNTHQARIADAVNDFMEIYPELIYKSKESLGALWKAEDYPHIGDLRDAYGIRSYVMPMPNINSISLLTEVSEEEKSRIIRQAEQDATDRINKAMASIWNRAYKAVSAFADAMGREKGRLHESLITNMVEFCDILPDLNITNDPVLAKMGQNIRGTLCLNSAEIYRADAPLRKTIADEASKIAAAMEAYF